MVSTWTIFSWFAWRYYRDAHPDITRDEIARRLDVELANLAAAGELLTADRRLGYYDETQCYLNTPEAIATKRRELQQLLETL